MIIVKTIREKYSEGMIRNRPISEIVVHGTGGGQNAQALISWMEGGERAESYKKNIGLFHYINDRDGKWYEIIDPLNWVYHSTSGLHDETTIGIENINPSPSNDAEYTDAQYDSLSQLVFKLIDQFPTITSIIGHGQNQLKYSGSYKHCPGNFNWERFKNMLQGFDFDGDEHLVR
jgi:hypothetical protein